MKILALDVGGTAIKSALVGEDGRLSDLRSTPSDHLSGGLIQNAIAVANAYDDYEVLSVAMTGQINHKTQTVMAKRNGTFMERAQIPLGSLFREAVKRPVFVLNDANAAALGEATFGAGRNHPDFLCLTYGTGVGGGIIQKGNLFTGQKGIAGEFGHMVIHAGGLRCRCGHCGCYEEYASTTALLREAKKQYPDLTDARMLFDQMSNEPELQRIVEDWVQEIVEGLCTLTYIFNPDCFVLGGGVMERADLLEQVRGQFRKRVIPSFSEVELLKAELGNRAGMIGAAVYARRSLSQTQQKGTIK